MSMANSVAFGRATVNRDLILETSLTFLQMAAVARKDASEPEFRTSYSYLGYNCARLRFGLIASWPDDAIILEVRSHLNSLLSDHALPPYIKTPEARLQTLNAHWCEVREQGDGTKSHFVRVWLRLGSFEEHRKAFDQSLDDIIQRIESNQPGKLFKIDSAILTSKATEPSNAVCKASQSILNSLLNCPKCTCLYQHDFAVRIEIGTNKLVAASGGHQAPISSESETEDRYHFNMFLRKDQRWHEISVQTSQGNGPSSSTENEHTVQQCQSHTIDQNSKVAGLCALASKVSTRPSQCLEIQVSGNELFEVGFRHSNFLNDEHDTVISLPEFIQRNPDHLTEKVKRVASLLAANMVLDMGGTLWLPNRWLSSELKLFETSFGEIPLRPFLEANLQDIRAQIMAEDSDPHSVQSDNSHAQSNEEMDARHNCPTLLSLATMLLELHFAMPFHTLAEAHGVELPKESDTFLAFVDIDLVFHGDVVSGVKGCRSKIPADYSYLLTAIDSCLNSKLWEVEDSQAVDFQRVLKQRIYHHVVQPLELHLSHGFSEISLESLASHSRTLDLAHWGQSITRKKPEYRPTLSEPNILLPSRTPSPGLVNRASHLASRSGLSLLEPSSWKQSYYHAGASQSMPDLGRNTDAKFDAQFFDDNVGDDDR